MAKPIPTIQVVQGDRKLQINKTDLKVMQSQGWKVPEPPKSSGKPEGGKPEGDKTEKD